VRSIVADPAGLAAAAQQLQELLGARGFETAQLRDAPGTPALVFGSLSRPGDITQRRSHPRLVKLAWEPGYPAFGTDTSLPAARALIAAMQRATQQPVALVPIMGGSVPIYLFADIFKVPVIGLPIVNHDDNQHAANENLRLQNLSDGIDTYAAMLSDLQW
jgi:hypothetical protein